MEMTAEIKNSFLNVPYLDCSETSAAYDYGAWQDFLASLESDKYNNCIDDLKDVINAGDLKDWQVYLTRLALKDVINAGNLKDWWVAGGNDPKGYGATMTYHNSILEEIENGMAEFNHTAPSYLCGMVEVTDIQLGSETARVIIQLSGVPTGIEIDDLETAYADEIRYRFSIPSTAGMGFVDKDDASVYYIEFKNDCLKG